MIGLPLPCLVSGLDPATPVKSVSSLTSEMWSLFCDTERNLIVACGASGLENSAAVPPAVLDTGGGRGGRGARSFVRLLSQE